MQNEGLVGGDGVGFVEEEGDNEFNHGVGAEAGGFLG